MGTPFFSRVPAVEAEIRGWLRRWPRNSREALRSRVLSSHWQTAYAALLELYTHEVLRTRFAEVLYEPEIAGTTNRPEFRAFAEGLSITVECKLVLDKETIRFADNELV